MIHSGVGGNIIHYPERPSTWELQLAQFLGKPSRPPLSKKLFPVCRVSKKTASREVGIFSPPNLIFL